MAALPDDILMAYADGELDADSHARVEAMVRSDADAARRVAMFQATGVQLSQLYRKPMLEPVPERLVDFVLNYGKEAATPAPAQVPAKSAGFKARLDAWREGFVTVWKEKLAPQGAGWQLAAASLASLAIGGTTGYLLSGGDEGGGTQLAAFSRGQIFARGSLREGLESLPSGQESRIAGGRQDATVMRVALTFKSKDGGFCREYEIAQAGAGQYSGLACRNDKGEWALQVNVPEMERVAGMKIADNSKTIDPVVDRLMEGDAFGPKEESALIEKGWK